MGRPVFLTMVDTERQHSPNDVGHSEEHSYVSPGVVAGRPGDEVPAPPRRHLNVCSWINFRQWWRKNQWLYQLFSNGGSVCFLTGTINSLVGYSTIATYLFITGSSFMLLGNLGETYVSYEETRISESQRQESEELTREENKYKANEDDWMSQHEPEKQQPAVVHHRVDTLNSAAHNICCCRVSWGVVRKLVRRYQLVHITIGNLGAILFLLGSVLLTEPRLLAAASLFTAGSTLLFVGTVGQVFVTYEQKRISDVQSEESAQWNSRVQQQHAREEAWRDYGEKATGGDGQDSKDPQSEHNSSDSPTSGSRNTHKPGVDGSNNSYRSSESTESQGQSQETHESRGDAEPEGGQERASYPRPEVSREGPLPDEVGREHKFFSFVEKYQEIYYAIQLTAYVLYIVGSALFADTELGDIGSILFITATSSLLLGTAGSSIVARQSRRRTEAEERSLQRRREGLRQRRKAWNVLLSKLVRNFPPKIQLAGGKRRSRQRQRQRSSENSER